MCENTTRETQCAMQPKFWWLPDELRKHLDMFTKITKSRPVGSRLCPHRHSLINANIHVVMMVTPPIQIALYSIGQALAYLNRA